MKISGAAPVPPSPPSMVTKSTPAAGRRPSASVSSSQKPRSPTADLMPDRQAGLGGQQLHPVEQAVGVGELGVPGRADAVHALGHARGSRRSRPTPSAPGSTPPSPGLAPWLSLISSARTGAPATRSFSRCEVEPALLVAAAEVRRADLEDQLAAVPVVRRQPALAGVVQAAGQRRAPVERLDRRAGQRAEAHRRDVDDRRRAGTRRARPRAAAEHLGARAAATSCAGLHVRRRHGPAEGRWLMTG